MLLSVTTALVAILPFQQDTSRYRSEDVTYTSGAVTLAAELMLPRQPGPHPAAVIIQGSGPSDRRNEWARAIAEELVRNGVAALLTDKRGSGASGGNWMTAGFDELADDAIAGVLMLQRRPDIKADRIGVAGLSQGGWIAPVAATRSNAIAFVIDVSGATVSFAEQSFHEMANTARAAGLNESEVEEVLALNRATGSYLLGGSWEEYARARENGLQRSWRRIAEGFPAAREQPIWTFLKKVAAFDPMPHWLMVQQPVLVVFGEQDEDDNVPVGESVRRLEYAFDAVNKKNYQIVVVPGAGHAVLNPQHTALAPEFTTALASWLAKYVGSGPGLKFSLADRAMHFPGLDAVSW